ncbi:MAG: endonuclease domain-containing protein [Steroidobacteraceae bacterium]|nr:endonuclease domain-containing protein [Steroidobacteraceae bacterium]
MREPRLDFARALRRNATRAERRLWRHLRCRGLANARFRRQHPIGRYVVDFICLEHRLIIEVDGGQHDGASYRQRDAERTAQLESQGFRVIRFWNHDVLFRTDAVLARIAAALATPPFPTPRGRG